MTAGGARPPGADAVPAEPPTASPCTGVCRIDSAAGWCEGCLRTLDEIAGWSGLDEAARRAVWQSIGLRRARRPDPSPTAPGR